MGTTDHYGLERLGQGSRLSDGGYKFTDGDRALMDRLLYLGAEGHHHGAAADAAPAMPTMTLTAAALSGSLPSGSRIYYRFALVDANGFEGAASTEQFVDTPAPVTEPGAPTLVPATTGGTLLAGQYFYVLSAYTGANTAETKALNPNYLTVPTGSTNQITLTLPTLPAGADGFNIYRRKPGDARYQYLASTTSTTTYLDDGSVAEDCNRTTPSRNATSSTNSVTADLGTVPVDHTWRLYRSLVPGSYDNALVHHVVEETSEGSGIITPTYTDMGLATLTGSPPATAQNVGSPSAIDLTDSADVTGALPMSGVSAFPDVVAFTFAGAQTVGAGTEVWVCEYPRASIQSVRAALGPGSTPVTQALIVDLNVGRGAVPVMASVFTSSADQPRVLVGDQIGERVVPTARTELVLGDVLTVDRDQVGGGATPGDRDLKVFVHLLIHGYTSPVSFVRPTSPFVPLQVPGIFGWYRASTLGLSDTNPVSLWTDLSGLGHHLVQATSGFRPTFRTGVLNSKPVVRLDGVDDYLRTADFVLTDTPITIIMVVKTSTVVGAASYIDGGVGSEEYLTRNSTPRYSMGSSAGPIVSTVDVDTSWHILACTWAGAASKLRIDGGAGTGGDAGSPSPTALTLGCHGDLAANFFTGDFAEIFAIQGSLDLPDLNGLGNYLATEYALTWATAV